MVIHLGIQRVKEKTRLEIISLQIIMPHNGSREMYIASKFRTQLPNKDLKIDYLIILLKFQDYKLAFNYRSTRWHGAAATIEHSPGDHVWGVVWELNKVHLATLDEYV